MDRGLLEGLELEDLREAARSSAFRQEPRPKEGNCCCALTSEENIVKCVYKGWPSRQRITKILNPVDSQHKSAGTTHSLGKCSTAIAVVF